MKTKIRFVNQLKHLFLKNANISLLNPNRPYLFLFLVTIRAFAVTKSPKLFYFLMGASSSVLIGPKLNFSELSSLERQNLLIESLQNKNIFLAYKFFTDNTQANYNEDSDIQKIALKKIRCLENFVRLHKQNFYEIDFLEALFNKIHKNEDVVNFLSKVISIASFEIKKSPSKKYLFREFAEIYQEAVSKILQNTAQILVSKSDVKSTALFYKSIDVSLRDEFEKNIAEIFDHTQKIGGYSKNDYLNSFVILDNLASEPSSTKASPIENLTPRTSPKVSSICRSHSGMSSLTMSI